MEKYKVVRGIIHGVSVGGTVELDPKEAKAYGKKYVIKDEKGEKSGKDEKDEKSGKENAKNKAILNPKNTK